MRNALRVLASLALLKSELQQLNVGLKLDWLLVSLIASLASLELAVTATLVFVGSLNHFLEKYHSANKRKIGDFHLSCSKSFIKPRSQIENLTIDENRAYQQRQSNFQNRLLQGYICIVWKLIITFQTLQFLVQSNR